MKQTIMLLLMMYGIYTLIARFMGPTWGPSGADRTQVGPMLAPWTLLSGYCWLSVPFISQNLPRSGIHSSIHGLVQEIYYSSVLEMELHISCTNPSMSFIHYFNIYVTSASISYQAKIGVMVMTQCCKLMKFSLIIFFSQQITMFIYDFFAFPCLHEICQYHLVQSFTST